MQFWFSKMGYNIAAGGANGKLDHNILLQYCHPSGIIVTEGAEVVLNYVSTLGGGEVWSRAACW